MSGSNTGADVWISEYISPTEVYVHGITRVLVHRRTAYQEMLIADVGAQGRALVLDGKWQSCTVDEFLYHEPLVHPAMIHQGGPRRVLILGGGEGATAREVLRWNTVERADMVDIDGEVVAACREHLTEMHQNAFDDRRLEVRIEDALKVLDDVREPWDVIISDLSDPIEEGPSFRLFTKEYFEQVKQALHPDGAFVLQAGPVSPNDLKMHACLVRTMRTVFDHVESYASFVPTYAAPWGFALASANPIHTRPEPADVDELLAKCTRGGFRMLDGITLLGLFQIPLHLRNAIRDADRVYTLKDPPKFHGTGVVGAAKG